MPCATVRAHASLCASHLLPSPPSPPRRPLRGRSVGTAAEVPCEGLAHLVASACDVLPFETVAQLLSSLRQPLGRESGAASQVAEPLGTWTPGGAPSACAPVTESLGMRAAVQCLEAVAERHECRVRLRPSEGTYPDACAPAVPPIGNGTAQRALISLGAGRWMLRLGAEAERHGSAQGALALRGLCALVRVLPESSIPSDVRATLPALLMRLLDAWALRTAPPDSTEEATAARALTELVACAVGCIDAALSWLPTAALCALLRAATRALSSAGSASGVVASAYAALCHLIRQALPTGASREAPFAAALAEAIVFLAQRAFDPGSAVVFAPVPTAIRGGAGAATAVNEGWSLREEAIDLGAVFMLRVGCTNESLAVQLRDTLTSVGPSAQASLYETLLRLSTDPQAAGKGASRDHSINAHHKRRWAPVHKEMAACARAAAAAAMASASVSGQGQPAVIGVDGDAPHKAKRARSLDATGLPAATHAIA